MPFKKPFRPLGPPPADPENYIIVKTKEGSHWRRKRGSLSEISLNSSFKKNNKLSAITSPSAKRIALKLNDYLQALETGRFIARVSGRLIKGWNKTGGIDYHFLKGYEIQPHRPMGELMPMCPDAFVIHDEAIWRMPIDSKTVKRLMKSITAYYFELILLYGDASKVNSLRIDSTVSQRYSYDAKGYCELSIQLPEKSKKWMVLLKVSCMHGDSLADGPRHNAMKIIAAG